MSQKLSTLHKLCSTVQLSIHQRIKNKKTPDHVFHNISSSRRFLTLTLIGNVSWMFRRMISEGS